MFIDENDELECGTVLRDRDATFTAKFDAIRSDNGATAKKLPPCSPNLNAYAERFVQTIKHECLNHFIVLGERHLNDLVEAFVDHYHHHRPHQGIANRTPVPSRGLALRRDGEVECESRLGGVIKRYYRAA